MKVRNHITVITRNQLDRIIALQILTVWAGEGLCEPLRPKWWRSDLVEALGGGDLMRRLLLKTNQWAALETIRTCMSNGNWQKLSRLWNPEQVRNLYSEKKKGKI